MARHNMLLGQARGKVGDLVFSRAFGKQIVRAKAAQVANPKTMGQNTQRAILATIAKAAAALTAIVDHSFAGVAYGSESVRHFRKINMTELRKLVTTSSGVNYNLSAKGAGFVPTPLKVSEGSLPAFTFDSDAGENPAFAQSTQVFAAGENPVQVNEFKRVYPFIQGGDQLTLVTIRKTTGSLVDGDALFTASYDRIVFAPNAFDDDLQEIIGDDGLIAQSCMDLTRTTNPVMLLAVKSGSGKLLGIPRDSSQNEDIYAVALILSRKVNNQWQRSTQYLELCEFKDTTDNQTAIDSYGVTESLSSATEYLNQATEGEESAGVSNPYLLVEVLGSGGNYIKGHTCLAGERYDLGDINLQPDLKIKVSAFGNEAYVTKRIGGVNIQGESADGAVVLVAEGDGNAKFLEFAAGEDGNLAGTYVVNAGIGNKSSKMNFVLKVGG